ncbi:MAG: glycosyltransferase [Desulfovibrionaceae bacterium]|nr:glycosyltransferase [Desulfovibrionaceae bacterium]
MEQKHISKSPLFSIITVCLNAPNVDATCGSIVGQTYDDFEWIVIDGGSDKKTLDVLEAYKWRMNYFVSEPDGGVYAAMNKGIRAANGAYLNFMNAGDSFTYSYTLACAKTMLDENHGVDVLYGEIYNPTVRGGKLTCSAPESMIYEDLYRVTIPHQGAFIRRDTFRRVGFYDETLSVCADWKHFVQLYKAGCTFKRWNHIVANFDGSGCSKNYELYNEERLKYIKPLFSREEIIRFAPTARPSSAVFQKLRAKRPGGVDSAKEKV